MMKKKGKEIFENYDVSQWITGIYIVEIGMSDKYV